VKLALLFPQAAPGGRARRCPSGGDVYDRQLTAALERRGHEALLVPTAPRADPAKLAGELAAAGFDALIEDELGHDLYRELNRRLPPRTRRVALVHVTTARLAPEARSAARERAFLASVDAAIFVSRQARRETERLLSLSPRAAVVHPGADHLLGARGGSPRYARAVSRPRLRCVSVGHFLPHKGQLELIEAFRGVQGPWSLALIGDGSLDRRYAARVQRAAEQLGRARIRLYGALSRPELVRALARADAFVSASAYESYGLAAAEAVAQGLPVVTWAEGGIWEFLEPERNALKVAPGDRAGLTHSFQRLQADARLLRRLAKGARATRLPSWDDAARRVERLVAALVREGKRAR
jgi:glycosyltransferase involved in cell wall biosynthesis